MGQPIFCYSLNSTLASQSRTRVVSLQMRISHKQTDFLRDSIHQFLPDASVHLFGSRADDEAKGGDIDIMVVGKRELSPQERRDIKIRFYKRFGEQKIDIVSFNTNDSSSFKKLALWESVEL
jgi:predicted nucleotidyltransferase